MEPNMEGAPSEALPTDAEKWDIFDLYINARSFSDQSNVERAASAFTVSPDVVGALFAQPYASLRVNGDPERKSYGAICFLTEDGVYQVRVMSLLRAGECYEFEWTFHSSPTAPGNGIPRGDLSHRKARIHRRKRSGGLTADTANVLCMKQLSEPVAPQDMTLRIFCPAIDETIDINLGDLSVRQQQSPAVAAAVAANKEAQRAEEMAPWRHLLRLLGTLRAIDRIAFERLPGPLKAALSATDLESRLSALTPTDLAPLQTQGMLPWRLAHMEAAYVPDLLLSIQIQQNLRKQAFITLQYQNAAWPIPPLVEAAIPDRLAPYDLQAMMTIGALREMRRLWDEKAEQLARIDPRVTVMLKGGIISQLQGRPEFAPLLSDPRILKEVQDDRDVQRRRAGNFDMSPAEVSRMIAYQQEMAMIPLGVGMTGGMLGGVMGLVGMESIKKKYASAPPAEGAPPWKVYEPYMC
jgi:hypothetical protein